MKPNAQRAQVPILVVDDEESMRHMLSLILTRAGYSVTSAEDGQHGIGISGKTALPITIFSYYCNRQIQLLPVKTFKSPTLTPLYIVLSTKNSAK